MNRVVSAINLQHYNYIRCKCSVEGGGRGVGERGAKFVLVFFHSKCTV